MAKSFPADVSNTKVDEGGDDPKLARVDLLDLIDKFNTTLATLAPLAAMVVGDGLTVTDNGAGNADTLIATPAPNATLPRGHLTGLKLSNNTTDATNDIDIAEGQCRSKDNAEDIILASALTKRIDASWAVGSGNGGLDTGAVSSTGTYHVHAILRSDTGVVDALFSLSPTAPTLPANYDLSRRIGSFMRVSGVNVPFTQRGDEFLRKVPINSVNASNPGTSAVAATLHVPTGVQVDALFSSMYFEGGDDSYLLFTSLDQTDTAPSATVFSIGHHISGTQKSGQFRIRTNTSAQVRYRVSFSGINTAVKITAHGWIDRRGRDD
jgi:hypothetical protein